MNAPIDLTKPVPAATLTALTALSRYFSTTIHGVENLPETGALLVGNHALAGIDSLAFLPALYHATGRVPRGLGLRALFQVPLLSQALQQCGAVAGDRENAVRLLESDELVVAYPGGSRDSLKSKADRSELKWKGRHGFAHVARQAKRPVVPVAAIGPDDVFPILADNGLRVGWLNNERLPVFLPIARRVPFDFVIGTPIEPPDGDDVESFVDRVQTELRTLIVNGLATRPMR
ncbi:MAG: lysophospholipid acyltransferase family protein [bacterium]